MFCRMPCQRVPVWITEKRLLQILGHPPGRYFIKENIFFGGKSNFILPEFRVGFGSDAGKHRWFRIETFVGSSFSQSPKIEGGTDQGYAA